MVTWITYIGITATVCAILAAMIAPMKHRSSSAWAASSFLFPPALIILIFLGKSRTGPYRPPPDDDDDPRRIWSD